MPKMDSPSIQNEQTSCSNWTDGCVQFEQSNTIDYTEITTENTSETSSSSKLANEEDSIQFFEKNGFGKIGDHYAKAIKPWCTKPPSELEIEAMKLASENGSKRWDYMGTILKNWYTKRYRNIKDIQVLPLALQKNKLQQTYKKPVRNIINFELAPNDKLPGIGILRIPILKIIKGMTRRNKFGPQTTCVPVYFSQQTCTPENCCSP